MKPVTFKGQTTTYAKDQDQYMDLPAHLTADGEVTSCWRGSLWERLLFIVTGKMWVTMLTFNKPLQPLRVSARGTIDPRAG